MSCRLSSLSGMNPAEQMEAPQPSSKAAPAPLFTTTELSFDRSPKRVKAPPRKRKKVTPTTPALTFSPAFNKIQSGVQRSISQQPAEITPQRPRLHPLSIDAGSSMSVNGAIQASEYHFDDYSQSPRSATMQHPYSAFQYDELLASCADFDGTYSMSYLQANMDGQAAPPSSPVRDPSSSYCMVPSQTPMQAHHWNSGLPPSAYPGGYDADPNLVLQEDFFSGHYAIPQSAKETINPHSSFFLENAEPQYLPWSNGGWPLPVNGIGDVGYNVVAYEPSDSSTE